MAGLGTNEDFDFDFELDDESSLGFGADVVANNDQLMLFGGEDFEDPFAGVDAKWEAGNSALNRVGRRSLEIAAREAEALGIGGISREVCQEPVILSIATKGDIGNLLS